MALPANVTTGTWTLDPRTARSASRSVTPASARSAAHRRHRGRATLGDLASTSRLQSRLDQDRQLRLRRRQPRRPPPRRRLLRRRDVRPSGPLSPTSIVREGDAYASRATSPSTASPAPWTSRPNSTARRRSLRQHARRPHPPKPPSPQGLRPDLERRPRGRRRPGVRQGCHQPGTGLYRSRSLVSSQSGPPWPGKGRPRHLVPAPCFLRVRKQGAAVSAAEVSAVSASDAVAEGPGYRRCDRPESP